MVMRALWATLAFFVIGALWIALAAIASVACFIGLVARGLAVIMQMLTRV